MQSKRTTTGSNGVLRDVEVGQGWESVVQQELEGWGRLEVLLRWGAYKHQTTTHPGSISISVARCVQICAR